MPRKAVVPDATTCISVPEHVPPGQSYCPLLDWPLSPRRTVTTNQTTTKGTIGVQAGAKDQAVAAHFQRFHQLDFEVFSHKKWDQLHLSHSKDVTVHWPDG